MTKAKRTTAIALAGAVALASGAYALGSQASDGSAEAAKGNERVGFGHGFGPDRAGMRPGFDGLADRLGVDEADLRAALKEIVADRRDDAAQRLADALGIDAAKVEEAFEDGRPERPRIRRPQAFAAALAKELGISTAKVRAALQERRGDLAAELGVSEQRLREAFHAVFGRIRPHRPGRADLAEELGVTQAQLEAAFDKLRDEFAQALADRLNVDVANVQDALDALHPPHFRGP
jgi:transcriptional regulator with XRE-family HTH domain